MTKNKELTLLTNEELAEKLKTQKKQNIINAFLIGLLFAVAIYGTAKKGFTFWSVFPFIIMAPLLQPLNEYRKLKKEIKSREVNS